MCNRALDSLLVFAEHVFHPCNDVFHVDLNIIRWDAVQYSFCHSLPINDLKYKRAYYYKENIDVCK